MYVILLCSKAKAFKLWAQVRLVVVGASSFSRLQKFHKIRYLESAPVLLTEIERKKKQQKKKNMLLWESDLGRESLRTKKLTTLRQKQPHCKNKTLWTATYENNHRNYSVQL